MKKIYAFLFFIVSGHVTFAQRFIPAPVITEAGVRWGFCDSTGKLSVPASFGSIYSDMTANRAMAEKNGKLHLINEKGETLFSTSSSSYSYDDIGKGKRIVRDSLNILLIDTDGKKKASQKMRPYEQYDIDYGVLVIGPGDTTGTAKVFDPHTMRLIVQKKNCVDIDVKRRELNHGSVITVVTFEDTAGNESHIFLDSLNNLLLEDTPPTEVKSDTYSFNIIECYYAYNGIVTQYSELVEYTGPDYLAIIDSFKTPEAIRRVLHERIFYTAEVTKDKKKYLHLYKYPNSRIKEVDITGDVTYEAQDDYRLSGNFFFSVTDKYENVTAFDINGKNLTYIPVREMNERFITFVKPGKEKVNIKITDVTAKNAEVLKFSFEKKGLIAAETELKKIGNFHFEVHFKMDGTNSGDTAFAFFYDNAKKRFVRCMPADGTFSEFLSGTNLRRDIYVRTLQIGRVFAGAEMQDTYESDKYYAVKDVASGTVFIHSETDNGLTAELKNPKMIYWVSDTFIGVDYSDRSELYTRSFKKLNTITGGTISAFVNNDPARQIIYKKGDWLLFSNGKERKLTDDAELSGIATDYPYAYGNDVLRKNYIVSATQKNDSLLLICDNTEAFKLARFSLRTGKLDTACFSSFYQSEGLEYNTALSSQRFRLLNIRAGNSGCVPNTLDYVVDTLTFYTDLMNGFFMETRYDAPEYMQNYIIAANFERNPSYYLTDLDSIFAKWNSAPFLSIPAGNIVMLGNEDVNYIYNDAKKSFDFSNRWRSELLFEGDNGVCAIRNLTDRKIYLMDPEKQEILFATPYVPYEFVQYGALKNHYILRPNDSVYMIVNERGKPMYDSALYYAGDFTNYGSLEDNVQYILLRRKTDKKPVIYHLKTNVYSQVPDINYEISGDDYYSVIFNSPEDSLKKDVLHIPSGKWIRNIQDPNQFESKFFMIDGKLYFIRYDEEGWPGLYDSNGKKIIVQP